MGKDSRSRVNFIKWELHKETETQEHINEMREIFSKKTERDHLFNEESKKLILAQSIVSSGKQYRCLSKIVTVIILVQLQTLLL